MAGRARKKINWWPIILLLLLPLFLWLVKQQTRDSSKAYRGTTLTASVPDIDPYTLEYYDMKVESSPLLIQTSGPGPVYLAKTTFIISGPRVSTSSSLYGFIQNQSPPEPIQINFSYYGGYQPRFISDAVTLFDSKCVDLYTTPGKTKDAYVASFCYKNTFVTPTSAPSGGTAYSPSANPWFTYKYTKLQKTVVQVLTTPFNKLNNNPPYDGLPLRGTRVHYFTIDKTYSSLSDFTSLEYHFASLAGGLPQSEFNDWCFLGAQYPDKYIKQTPDPRPEGGSNFLISQSEGMCQYKYSATAFIPFYLSLYKNPLFSPTPTITTAPTPTPSTKPTCKPRPTCLDAKPACKLPTPIGGWCKKINPSVAPAPIKDY